MADKNNSAEAIKAVGPVIVAVAGLITTLATPVIDVLKEKFTPNGTSNGELVEIPILTQPDSHIRIDQASTILSGLGLIVTQSELGIGDALPKYRNYRDNQIVDILPGKKKMPVGSSVVVRYVTQAVIDASKELYVSEQRKQAEIKKRKEEERTKAIGNTKEKIKNLLPHKKKD